MENPRSSITAKLKSLDDVVPPMNKLNFPCGLRYSSIFDPYATDSSDSPSPLMKYLCSANPAAIVDSPPVFRTPVKVEEDVIVMDGIPVPKSNKKCGEVRPRLPLMSSSVVGGIAGGSNSTSWGGGARGNGSDNSKSYKNRLCRFWGTCGTCQFGSECQFAHGKEELRPTRSSCKIQLEISNLDNNLEGLSLSSYGTKYTPMKPLKAIKAAAAAEAVSLLPSVSKGMVCTSPVKVKLSSEIPNTNPPKPDWTPEDDGIEVSLPGEKNPCKQDVDAHMVKVLYETISRKRLPVFVEICPN